MIFGMVEGMAQRAWETYVDVAWGLLPAVRCGGSTVVQLPYEWALVAGRLTAQEFGDATVGLRAVLDQAEAGLRAGNPVGMAHAVQALIDLADQLCALAGVNRPLH
ncbi:hypothetical protein [Catellatospora sp. NPDC049609]|uniref:hypothetical protein n=1 Tax=Catellatospora sp. NPDC049609 TaxID=3155505 RepID=UPI00341C38BD